MSKGNIFLMFGIFVLIFISNSQAQDTALVIKHIGVSNKTTQPFILANNAISRDFLIKFVANSRADIPYHTYSCIVNGNVIVGLESYTKSLFDSIGYNPMLPKTKYPATGTLEFRLIVNDSLVCKYFSKSKEKSNYILSKIGNYRIKENTDCQLKDVINEFFNAIWERPLYERKLE